MEDEIAYKIQGKHHGAYVDSCSCAYVRYVVYIATHVHRRSLTDQIAAAPLPDL